MVISGKASPDSDHGDDDKEEDEEDREDSSILRDWVIRSVRITEKQLKLNFVCQKDL